MIVPLSCVIDEADFLVLKEIETEDLNWQRADRGDRDSSEHHASGESEEGKE